MTTAVKICGLTTPDAVRAAIDAGAAYLGFVFYPPSPRHLSPARAAALLRAVPAEVTTVGVVVDPSDDVLDEIVATAAPDILQLHGRETPERVREVRERWGLPVMKAIAVAGPQDIALAKSYEDAADLLLFDAKAPETLDNALPGGNGLVFDWRLIRGEAWALPWMLSGGLNRDNVAEAIAISGAEIIDVSSGVESRPGIKDTHLIQDFIAAARNNYTQYE